MLVSIGRFLLSTDTIINVTEVCAIPGVDPHFQIEVFGGRTFTIDSDLGVPKLVHMRERLIGYWSNNQSEIPHIK